MESILIGSPGKISLALTIEMSNMNTGNIYITLYIILTRFRRT